MAIKGLKIIGESINDSVPSTNRLFTANDIDGIVELARSQDEKGAAYIDVNIGRRTPEFMADMVRRIQQVSAKPLSIDTPDFDIARAGMEAYDESRAGGQMPVLNSISPLRLELFDLYKIRPFIPILMVSEHADGEDSRANKTAEETYETAQYMLEQSRTRIAGFDNRQCIIDPGIAPIGSDSENNLKRLIHTLKLMQEDAAFAGIHVSVGLSNFTVMLPPKRADGLPVKSALESAFLTLAMPLGLDMVIGSMARQYALLEDGHPAMTCLRDALEMDGFDVIMRVQEFYSS